MRSSADRSIGGIPWVRTVLAAQLLLLAGLLTVALVVGALAPITPTPALRLASKPRQPSLTAGRQPRAADTYPLVYPLRGGAGQVIGRFGDARAGGRRSHDGIDIAAPKLTPVLAVADGVVLWIHGPEGPLCCDLALLHDDGWSSRYIHLNNDTPGTDDGRGLGIRSGLAVGDAVQAGDLLGWVGDSGNAEATPPHLHFELRDRNGLPVDPLRGLEQAAERPR